MDKASLVFDDKREDNALEKLDESRKEQDAYAKSWSAYHAGRLVQKNPKKFVDLTGRVNLVKNLMISKELPASLDADLLDINCTSIYYKDLSTSEWELECKAIIDQPHTDYPTWEARQIAKQL